MKNHSMLRRAPVLSVFAGAYAVVIGLTIIFIVGAHHSYLRARLAGELGGALPEPPKSFPFRSQVPLLESPLTFVDEQKLDSLGTALKQDWFVPPIKVSQGGELEPPAVDATGTYFGINSAWFFVRFEGKMRWRFHANGGRGLGGRTFFGVPTLDQNAVYVGSVNGTLYALGKKDGHPFWSLKVGMTLGGSPVVTGDSIYVTMNTGHFENAAVVRVDRLTGKIVWQSDWLNASSMSSPVVDSERGQFYAASESGQLSAFDLKSGKKVWTFANEEPVHGLSFVIEDKIFVISHSGNIRSVNAKTGTEELKGELAETADKKWLHPKVAPRLKSQESLVLILKNNLMTAYDAKTGHIFWQTATEYTGAPVIRVADSVGLTWFTCGANLLCQFNLSNGRVARKMTLPGRASSQPTLFENSLYVTVDDTGLIKLSHPQGAGL